MASPRVAVMSVHTSPMDQPGSGDSGGMNVYIRAVTERLARRGVEVDLFTRCRGGDTHDVREIAPGIRVVSVKAGPCTPVPKEVLPRFLPEFLGGVLRIARERLHLSGLRLALYVGRLQGHKGPDVAVRTLAEAVARDPDVAGHLVLGIVGGPSGTDQGAELSRLLNLAAALGVSDRVMLFPPQPQARLADFYAAADVVLVPSRSESFGLVALEAQACGIPVVAAAVGGLRYVVEDGRTGFLVEGHDPGDHTDRLLEILRDPALAARMGGEAARQALRFTWDATAQELMSVYDEVRNGRAHTP